MQRLRHAISCSMEIPHLRFADQRSVWLNSAYPSDPERNTSWPKPSLGSLLEGPQCNRGLSAGITEKQQFNCRSKCRIRRSRAHHVERHGGHICALAFRCYLRAVSFKNSPVDKRINISQSTPPDTTQHRDCCAQRTCIKQHSNCDYVDSPGQGKQLLFYQTVQRHLANDRNRKVIMWYSVEVGFLSFWPLHTLDFDWPAQGINRFLKCGINTQIGL